MDIRYANHPEDVKRYDTESIRKHFLIENLFIKDEINLTYSHVDRFITGGAFPVDEVLNLENGKEIGLEYFLQRREMGVINIGGKGVVILDGAEYEMEPRDGIYIGMGIKEIKFKSVDRNNPAKFYFNSVPAHTKYPTVKIEISKANPIKLGDLSNSNQRTIYQYVHPNVCRSCQLLMGMTILEPNNVWNTMPCHTHERRMEVYFYFNMDEGARVIHFMGKPNETRHIIVANEQAVISPSWSIHSGVGTSNYTFIWGMAGENQEFNDMDVVDIKEMR